MTVFLGVYKAIYSYEPQTDEELRIEEDDLLYVLEKSEVDDWWTVKKREIGTDTEELVGLVPNNYIEEADVLYQVHAIYDYKQVQNPDEELSFQEGDVFDIFDDRDADWFLVRAVKDKKVGFIPGNYVETIEEGGRGGNVSNVDMTEAPRKGPSAAASSMQPPNNGRANVPESVGYIKPTIPTTQVSHVNSNTSEIYDDRPLPKLPTHAEAESESEGEQPPAKPVRPEDRANNASRKERTMTEYRVSSGNYSINSRSWDVHELNGRKKTKARLTVRNNLVIFVAADDEPKSWPIQNLLSCANEKKHMFLEFKDPYANIEIHTGSSDLADEIKVVFGELKGAVNDKALREIEAAAHPSPKKVGLVKFDFDGVAEDELSVKAGSLVLILNDEKSLDWWMCELVSTGKKGVVPAKFIEVQKDPKKGSTSLNINKQSSGRTRELGDWKNDAEQDSTRKQSVSKKGDKKPGTKKKRFPDPNNTRIWVDKSNTFKVEAEYLGYVDGKVHLHKVNGVKIAVAVEKLSVEDLQYLEKLNSISLDQYKPRGAGKTQSGSSRGQEEDVRRLQRQQDDAERDREGREQDRRLRERELNELRKARDLLDQEREKLKAMTGGTSGPLRSKNPKSEDEYDWFEFFLNCGVDVNNCQRYTLTFENQQISEQILPDIQPQTLRALELREGDVIRVMKYLNQKYGRKSQSSSNNPSGEADQSGLSDQLLPLNNVSKDDVAWTVKPAAKSETLLPQTKKEFSGSLQDLLDLKPLEPKKKDEIPQPNLQDLEHIKTGSSTKLSTQKTGSFAAPLDPFKTGGHNLMPNITGGLVLLPVATGSMIPVQDTGGLIPLQRTGGIAMPETTFGTQITGGILPVQKTANGLLPAPIGASTLMSKTTFGTGPMLQTVTGGMMPLQHAGGMMSSTSMIPQTTFGTAPMNQTTFGTAPMNQTTTGGILPFQRTGGGLPVTSTVVQQTTVSTGPISQAFTGGMMPVQRTMGGFPSASIIPQTTFGTGPIMQQAGGIMPLQRTGGPLLGTSIIPQTTFSNVPLGQTITGGAMALQNTGGALMNMPQSFGQQQQMALLQQNRIFEMNMQRTGDVNSFPQTSFGVGGMNQITNDMQGMNLNQQQPLQNQPTGFGFGNAPPPQQRQANLYNASAANPFGF
ncbi:cytoskeletal protein-binding protein SLA1 Ecym_7231 [Eremothecium cymbalariae DBVPG|uniref:Actin cytoskeleton-regulatory complex protein SLA1 n=1 Tax=Eremothecium cymbalariae (strain CBS 270.75 / DBVPG 7215 / KCTC 17166 / NRRL Y-17582) TaxID=931890 RepID=G8JW62_ERECY|nr:hypothetical protein Ecym_7231 [Eremothecium cymbalariae DBVPG\